MYAWHAAEFGPAVHAEGASCRSDVVHEFWWSGSFVVVTPAAQPGYFEGQVFGAVHARGTAPVSHVAPIALQSVHALPPEPQRLSRKPPTQT